VLNWGDSEAAERIRDSAALYNVGVRMNELCEDIFGKRPDLLKDPMSRERLVDVCQRFRWMSVREVDDAFRRISNSFDPARIPTEARDLGRPAEPPVQSVNRQVSRVGGSILEAGLGGPVGTVQVSTAPKVVIFCLDWSASMMSRDTRTPLNRFETCVACVKKIMQDQVRDYDYVGVVCFGPKVDTIVPPSHMGTEGKMINGRISQLRPAQAGGTCFFDAVELCLKMLDHPGALPPDALRWLVCLTDGDDLGSRAENARGGVVTRMLDAGISRLNMVMITVGALKSQNVQIIDHWIERVSATGGLAKHVSEKDASAISQAFDVVAECLAAEVGGATEC